MAKTIEQWLLGLDGPDSLNAYKYAQNHGSLNKEVESMSEAIYNGFPWPNTEEGNAHWANVYHENLMMEDIEEQSKE